MITRKNVGKKLILFRFPLRYRFVEIPTITHVFLLKGNSNPALSIWVPWLNGEKKNFVSKSDLPGTKIRYAIPVVG